MLFWAHPHPISNLLKILFHFFNCIRITSFSLIFPAVPKNVHIVLSESGVTNIKQVPVGNSSFFFDKNILHFLFLILLHI